MQYLIKKDCPDFVAPALMPDGTFENAFRLSDFFAGHYGVIFFFPLDFNYISWTELLSVQKRIQEFAALNTKIVGISGDTHLAHRTWRALPRGEGGLGPLGFPMAADMTRGISRLFDVLV